MKLKFKNQEFQTDAVNSVVDLFLGQEKTKGTFSVDNDGMDNFLGSMGVGNALLIDYKTLADNMHAVQRRNNLPLTDPDWGFHFLEKSIFQNSPSKGRPLSSVLKWKPERVKPMSTPRPFLS